MTKVLPSSNQQKKKKKRKEKEKKTKTKKNDCLKYAYINNHFPVFHITGNKTFLKDDLAKK